MAHLRRLALHGLVLLLLCLPACGPAAVVRDTDPAGAPDDGARGEPGQDPGVVPYDPVCTDPSTPAGPEVALAPEFAADYTVWALGTVPGVPNPLGGIVVQHDDPGTLLVAGGSESPDGAIYAIHVRRDDCGHILGFDGEATRVAETPYVDANLVYGPDALLLFTEWPQYALSQLASGDAAPTQRTDLRTLGLPSVDDQGPGGVGFVPAALAAAGELRLVTWPAGRWVHVGATVAGGLLAIESLTETATLPNNPGGFAYVPAGSPGFPSQSLIVAEWVQNDATRDRVAVYETDAQGDPLVDTRREFFAKFPRPWGAYFEPVTGDYLFLTWGAGDDRVYLVRGFVPPEEIF